MEFIKPPPTDASDEDWRLYSHTSCDLLIPHLRDFLSEHFSYTPRYVRQTTRRTGRNIAAFTKKYDLYLRLFQQPYDFWPRECLVIARVRFIERRAGHGRRLIEKLIEMAPVFGYKFLAIECANNESSAFGERMGFTSYENGDHWVGSIHDIQQALSAYSND